MEVSVALGFAGLIALLMLKASLLSISGNQWTIMQTLTDAYLTRETALANRIPLADLTGAATAWPDPTIDDPPRNQQTVVLGKLAGGHEVQAELTRFRVEETNAANTDTPLSVWRLHSILTYAIGGHQYVKSRSTLRMQ